MTQGAKTIQIHLPDGDPRRIRMADLTTRTVRVFDVPRSLVSHFLQLKHANQVGVYFLIGDMGEQENRLVYIGQSGDVGARISNHNLKKDFWNRALIAVSLTDSFTQTHGLYLEWKSIRDALAAGRYEIENGNAGTQPHTPAPLQADCNEIHETIDTLLSTLGYPLFTSVVKKSASIDFEGTQELFYCKSSGANGIGLYTEEGFVVLKGSSGRLESVPSLKASSIRFRQRLIDVGAARADGDFLVFVRDHLFNSPSMAAVGLIGRAANGWLEWRDKNGKTLDELKRQVSE